MPLTHINDCLLFSITLDLLNCLNNYHMFTWLVYYLPRHFILLFSCRYTHATKLNQYFNGKWSLSYWIIYSVAPYVIVSMCHRVIYVEKVVSRSRPSSDHSVYFPLFDRLSLLWKPLKHCYDTEVHMSDNRVILLRSQNENMNIWTYLVFAFI
jgi:hypothetical protein